jgi:guanylate kinase
MNIPKPGKVVLVAGLYCAGKTTLIAEVLRRVGRLSYITTYTTREPRPNEKLNGTHEYEFVSQREYDRLCQTPGWDHTQLRGVSYGSDAAKISAEVAGGRSYIVVTTMYPDQIQTMRSKYFAETVLIFLDTDFEICQRRIMAPGSGRSRSYLTDPAQSREQANVIRELADYVYSPAGPLEEDRVAFVAFIQDILENRMQR